MSFSESAFHVIGTIAIVAWVFRILIACERAPRMRMHRRYPDPDRSLKLSPRWDSQETE